MSQNYYTFLPWLRRGVINLANAGNITAENGLTISATLNVEGQGESEPIKQDLHLYGPGDILGIDQRAIVRTIPRTRVQNFEANFLCGIEFYEEDYPWRYTPALAANSQLSPWIWLTVLRDEEFVRQGATETALRAIKINADSMPKAFPQADTAWAWAHTHLSGEPSGVAPEAVSAWANSLLAGNPALGCSRLLCPRRLQPGTRYTAFLVPAFERGRLAGLGIEYDNKVVSAAMPSWPEHTQSQGTFPVYYEWQFITDSAGDFEQLARRLAPLTKQEEQQLRDAIKMIDISAPGWGLKHDEARLVPLKSALQLPGPSKGRGLLEGMKPGQSTTDTNYLIRLQGLLNLGAAPLGVTSGGSPITHNPFYPESTVQDDPMIVPPLYGSFYRGTATTPVKTSYAYPVNDWYNQLNLDPAMRVAAAAGTAVVQKEQELYVDRAWDQMEKTMEMVRIENRWAYSQEVSQQFYNKRILPMLSGNSGSAGLADAGSDEGRFLALTFAAPLFQSLLYNDNTYPVYIRNRTSPSAYTRSFTKVIRKNGPVMRKLNSQVPAGPFFGIVRDRPKESSIEKPFNDSLRFLTSLKYDSRNPNSPLYEYSLKRERELKEAGLVDASSCLEAGEGIVLAGRKFDNYRPWPPPEVDASDLELFQSIPDLINPVNTFPSRMAGILSSGADITLNTPFSPEFPEPMYKELATYSKDYILPGLDKLPNNRVMLLQQNQSFIESYMVGLNHEMLREFLWREFPVPLNGTAFRQFWDARDNYASEGNSEDISRISAWNNSELGKHRPIPTDPNNTIIMVRGDLLKKYPNTEIFMQKSKWTDTSNKYREPDESQGPLYPQFSGLIDPDYKFFCFNIFVDLAIGTATDPGWFFVLKERAGEVQFGLDLDRDSGPSWPIIESEVPENKCINAKSPLFKSMRTGMLERADHVAALLYQQPFMLLIHASRLIKKN